MFCVQQQKQAAATLKQAAKHRKKSSKLAFKLAVQSKDASAINVTVDAEPATTHNMLEVGSIMAVKSSQSKEYKKSRLKSGTVTACEVQSNCMVSIGLIRL